MSLELHSLLSLLDNYALANSNIQVSHPYFVPISLLSIGLMVIMIFSTGHVIVILSFSIPLTMLYLEKDVPNQRNGILLHQILGDDYEDSALYTVSEISNYNHFLKH